MVYRRRRCEGGLQLLDFPPNPSTLAGRPQGNTRPDLKHSPLRVAELGPQLPQPANRPPEPRQCHCAHRWFLSDASPPFSGGTGDCQLRDAAPHRQFTADVEASGLTGLTSRDWRTSASRSLNAAAAYSGLIPSRVLGAEDGGGWGVAGSEGRGVARACRVRRNAHRSVTEPWNQGPEKPA
jgi:hypothetical protein